MSSKPAKKGADLAEEETKMGLLGKKKDEDSEAEEEEEEEDEEEEDEEYDEEDEEDGIGDGVKGVKKLKKLGIYDGYLRPCIVEFVATCLFVCLGCLSVQNPLGANIPLPSAVAVALCHGFLAAALITIFGNVSGGHFNPAVTLAFVICRGINPVLGVLYFIAQMLGSIAGAFLTMMILPMDSYAAIAGGAHILTAVNPGKGIACEMILTGLLVLTVLHSFINDRPKDINNMLGPVAVGFTIAAALLAGVGITGGSLNPVRSFGPAVALSVISTDAWPKHYVFWVGPLCGTIIASVCFLFLTADAGKRCCAKKKKTKSSTTKKKH